MDLASYIPCISQVISFCDIFQLWQTIHNLGITSWPVQSRLNCDAKQPWVHHLHHLLLRPSSRENSGLAFVTSFIPVYKKER